MDQAVAGSDAAERRGRGLESAGVGLRGLFGDLHEAADVEGRHCDESLSGVQIWSLDRIS